MQHNVGPSRRILAAEMGRLKKLAKVGRKQRKKNEDVAWNLELTAICNLR